MFLSLTSFQQVVEASPLVSIDLVVRDEFDRVLLGLRRNRPAQGFWFAPGGRILKNERLEDAFMRLTLEELGKPFLLSSAKFVGVSEHIYPDSIFGEKISTHYIVLCYLLDLPSNVPLMPPTDQHQKYRWGVLQQIKDDLSIHQYTRIYFGILPPHSSFQEH